MATNIVSSHFLDLPTDILLEILGRLPATSIILHCRLVCRRMNHLSRNSHLWVQYLNQTKDVLRPPLGQEQIGTTEFERIICQTETLKKIWSDDSALRAAPRFWRGTPYTPKTNYGIPVGIMGEYMILERYHERVGHNGYNWVFIHDQNGRVIFNYDIVSEPISCYMDSSTHTFYVAFVEAPSLVVIGFQANASGPHKAFEYRSRLRSDLTISWLWVQDGFAYLEYYGAGSNIEMDIIALRKRDVSRFSLPGLVSFLPGAQNPDETFTKFTATDAHLICVVDQRSETGCVVFRRPTTALDPQLLDSNEGLLGEDLHLGSTVTCNLPDASISASWVVACSLTSFAIVQIWQRSLPFPDDQCRPLIIRVLLLTTLDEKVSIEDIGSTTIPGLLQSFILPAPPFPVRYVLGILGIQAERATSENQSGQEYFALKIDLPCPEQNRKSENKCQIALTKMCFAPVVDMSKEDPELNYFDHFSGRVVLSVSPNTRLPTGVVIDYLSTAM